MNDSRVTLISELVVVGTAVSAGFAYMAEVWASPNAPLIWMGSAGVAFVLYAVVSAIGDLRRLSRAHVEGKADVEQDAAAPARVDPASAVVEDSQSLTLGAPSEDATEFLSLDDLRPETEADLQNGDENSIPLFAESTMSFKLRDLVRQGATPGQPAASSSDASAERPSPAPGRAHTEESP